MGNAGGGGEFVAGLLAARLPNHAPLGRGGVEPGRREGAGGRGVSGTRVNHSARRRARSPPRMLKGGGRGHALAEAGGGSRGSARLFWVARALVCK